MRKTRLMAKLFSSATPQEYKDEILSKIDEAHDNGSATLESDGEKLQFADVEGDIIVEDQTDGVNEVTRISQNPENENDLVMSEVEVPVEEEVTEEVTEEPTEEEVTEETVTESDNLESIEIKRIPGPDGEKAEDIVDDLEIDINTGIEDDEKSGTNAYSLKFKNYSKKKAQIFAKVFAHCADCIDEVVKSADVDEDVQVKFEDGQMKVMSVIFGKPAKTFSLSDTDEEVAEEEKVDINPLVDEANDLADAAEDINKENASEIIEKAESIIEACENCEKDRNFSLKAFKTIAKAFADAATEVLDAEEVTEENPAEETPATEETPAEEVTEEAVEETKEESNANPQVLQCEESGKWYIEEDPEKKMYDTQEEAEQVAAKSFSEPSVTLTVEGLEPSSVSQLLGGPKEEEEEKEVEPKVDPNEGFETPGAGRHFSMPAKKDGAYNNPCLTSEIY